MSELTKVAAGLTAELIVDGRRTGTGVGARLPRWSLDSAWLFYADRGR